jgi:hypothetical protein
MPVRSTSFHHYINSALVFLDHRQRPPGSLQQCGQFCFYEAMLLLRIANMTQRRSHVKRPTGLTLEEDIIAAQMDFGRLACCSQLFEMAVTKFALLILFVADSLSVSDALGNRRRCSYRSLVIGFRVRGSHRHILLLQLSREL